MQTTWRKRSEHEYEMLDEQGVVLAVVARRTDTHWVWFELRWPVGGREITLVAAMRAAERAAGVTV